MKMAFRSMSNVGWNSRMKQALILLIAIVLGVIISSAVDAQDFGKANKRHFKARYKQQINIAPKECNLLNKKRNALRESAESNHRRRKYKPQAEVDPPRYAVAKKRFLNHLVP